MKAPRKLILSTPVLAALVATVGGVFGTATNANAEWKWVNVHGDCVDTCSRDDCPCYRFPIQPEG
jgi:hypothetical protein